MTKKEIREFNKKIRTNFGVEMFFDKKDKVTINNEFIEKDGEIVFFYSNERIMPCLRLILKNNFLRKVTVDMGAVKFVVSGADIMRPGITSLDQGIAAGELVAIIDETHGKPLAIGEMMFPGEEVSSMNSGKVIKNLHYIGDKVWNS